MSIYKAYDVQPTHWQPLPPLPPLTVIEFTSYHQMLARES